MAPTLRNARSHDAAPTSNIKLEDEAADVRAVAAAETDERSSKAVDAGSKLPRLLAFPLTVALSLALSTLGGLIIPQVSRSQLDSLTRTPDTWGEAAILAGWRILELGLAWFGKLDSVEAGSLKMLANGPTYYLMMQFYGLNPWAALSAAVVDVLSVTVPFHLVLPLSTAYEPSLRSWNRDLVDLPMLLLTSLLSTGIYTVTLVLSLRFLLPRTLVAYFNGIPTLEPAYSASYADALPAMLLLGFAASTFVFPPFAATGRAKEDAQIDEFDPVNATLGQTVWWNFWGYTAKEKVVIRRTAAAAALSGVGTYLACTRRMYGIEATGAAAYAAVWATAAVLAGLGLGFVGRE